LKLEIHFRSPSPKVALDEITAIIAIIQLVMFFFVILLCDTNFNMYAEFPEHIERVTFWAASDSPSWRKWGRPVLFDQNLQAKDAFHTVINCAKR